ncbi:MAG TPA: hypothetical protein PK530_02995, partial [Anaerolineales bacterium]|nr:hypothetical protein [Anaerolineales bacterium]
PAATEDDFLTPIVNIDGQGYTGVNPPDTVGDVGPNHYIQMINGSGGAIFRVYDKTGNPLTGSIDLDSFGTGACAGGIGDPVILYDQMADRWMLTEFSGSANVLCVYISQGPDPINDGWYAYNFTTPNFPDYPKYGVWPDGYYVTSNENSPAAYALDRVNMLIGAAATSIRFTAPPLSGFSFQALTPSDLDGEDLPPAGAPNYFMRHRDTEAHGNGNCTVAPDEDCLEIWAFHADFATPANSTFTEIADINIADFDSELCGFSSFNCFQQPGTGTTLDPLREVIMFRLVYRNFGTYEALVGNLVTDVDDTDHGGVRWFELRKQGAGAWNLYQEGTYAPDSHSRWMGAIAMDGSGNIAVGYNVSSTTQYPSLRYAGRLVTDPLGTLPQSEGVLVNGTASNSSNRYGDYSAMSVDPSDDCTFWFTGEYNNGGNWSTRIGAFKFEACGSPFFIETTPATAEACIVNTDEVAYTVAIGQNVLFTNPVTLATGTLPANVSADFSVNPVTPADPPATSTLTLSGLTGSSAGSYSVAVTGAIPTRTMTSTVQLSLYDALTSPTNLLTPTDGETDVTPAPTFSWDAVPNAQGYDLEIATDVAFTNIVFTASTTETSYGMPIALDELHTYYWRVRPTNLCGEGVYSNTFSFTTREVPSILIVDDDDNSPNVRTYYTVALDDLGWAYDVWDTTTIGGEPTAPDLAPYQTVIWFTGDQTSGTTGPDEASETALSTWLDNTQGCFLLSSQDYYQDQGLTPFMTDYLGVGTLSEGEGNYGQVIG